MMFYKGTSTNYVTLKGGGGSAIFYEALLKYRDLYGFALRRGGLKSSKIALRICGRPLMRKIWIFQAKILFKIYPKILDSTITNSSETAQLFRIPIKCSLVKFNDEFFQLLQILHDHLNDGQSKVARLHHKFLNIWMIFGECVVKMGSLKKTWVHQECNLFQFLDQQLLQKVLTILIFWIYPHILAIYCEFSQVGQTVDGPNDIICPQSIVLNFQTCDCWKKLEAVDVIDRIIIHFPHFESLDEEVFATLDQ